MIVSKYAGDNLIATNAHPVTGQTVTVESGAGELERGALLGRKSNDKFVMLSSIAKTAGATAEVVLASDVDASDADAIAEVYNSGDFNENALKVGKGYTIGEDDRKALKDAGIYLSNSVITASVLPIA